MIFRDAGRLSHLSDEAAAPRKTRTAEKSAPYWGLTGFAHRWDGAENRPGA